MNGTAIPTVVYSSTWGLIPAGLSEGDTFRLLFLSSTGRNATSSDIEDYNAFVQNRAAAGHADIREYSAGFRVVGCTEATDARDNTRTTGQGVPIYWLGGNRLADDYGDFYDGDWDDEANPKDELGANGPDTSVAANYPITGCGHDGTEKLSTGQSPRPLATPVGFVRAGQPNDRSGHGPIARQQLLIPLEQHPSHVRGLGGLPGWQPPVSAPAPPPA